MGLRKIDLTKVNTHHSNRMPYEEQEAELKKPRAERKGLPKMPADMCMSSDEDARFVESAIARHQRSNAEKARAMANARRSNCL